MTATVTVDNPSSNTHLIGVNTGHPYEFPHKNLTYLAPGTAMTFTVHDEKGVYIYEVATTVVMPNESD